jgi:cytochrome oxidase Cu insertion factor (SCO1/SenC/PrrC family)
VYRTVLGTAALLLCASFVAAEAPAVGKKAPEIKGEDLDGKAFKLSDYRGKVVLLDFWGFW